MIGYGPRTPLTAVKSFATNSLRLVSPYSSLPYSSAWPSVSDYSSLHVTMAMPSPRRFAFFGASRAPSHEQRKPLHCAVEYVVPIDFYAKGYLEQFSRRTSPGAYRYVKDWTLKELVEYACARGRGMVGIFRITVGTDKYTKRLETCSTAQTS
jgi:hypothetical protein